MSKNEIGIEEGRKRFGDLVIAAQQRGQITIVTRYGKPAAAIVPASLIPQEPTIDDATEETQQRAAKLREQHRRDLEAGFGQFEADMAAARRKKATAKRREARAAEIERIKGPDED